MALDEDAQAQVDIWKYAFGYINPRVVKTAVELEIADVLEKHGGPISLSELSSAVGCPSDLLYRIMRFLIHHGIFKKVLPPSKLDNLSSSVYYAHNPLSRLFTRGRMGPFMLLHATPSRSSGGMSAQVLRTRRRPDLKSVNGEDIWNDPTLVFHKKVFTDAMAAHARVKTSAIISDCPEVFEGIGSLVDVGGRNGTALGMLVKAFPWFRGICFDLPEVVVKASPLDGIKFVGGSMFESVPKADAVMLMSVLHDWSDKACVDILKKCKEAIPTDTGKLIIVDAIIDEDGEGDEYTGARLSLDMMMMAVTVQGKERTYKEWAHLLNEAGFTRHNVKNIKAIEGVIEAYPNRNTKLICHL